MCCFVVLSTGCGEENSVAPKSHRQILAMMGAKGTEAASEQDIQQYKNIFGRMDADGDGRLTEEQSRKNSNSGDNNEAKRFLKKFNWNDRCFNIGRTSSCSTG